MRNLESKTPRSFLVAVPRTNPKELTEHGDGRGDVGRDDLFAACDRCFHGIDLTKTLSIFHCKTARVVQRDSAKQWVLAAPSVLPNATIGTWLILPVVICLSQRLSHARLSINFYTVKLRMAH